MIEQCVGAKNYRQFYILCWSQLIVSGTHCLYVILISITSNLLCSGWSFYIAIQCLFYNGWETEGQLDPESSDRSYIGWFWRIMLFLWMLYQAFMASSLVGFHTYLVMTQQTTFELLKPKKLKARLKYEYEQNKSSPSLSNVSFTNIDISGDSTTTKPKRKKRGIPGPIELTKKFCKGLGCFQFDYPFSQGLCSNLYQFCTAECLERPEYFKTHPVKLIKSTPKPVETTDTNNDNAPEINGNDVDKK